MSKFIILYRFNLKRMNKSFMFWIFVIVALIAIPFGLFYFTKDWDPTIYNQIAVMDVNQEDVHNLGFFVLFITYFFTVFSGATITNSVANERISKVSDLLTYHVSPVKIVYSKIAALMTLIFEAIVLIAIECCIIQFMGFIHLEKILFFMRNIGIGIFEIAVISIMSLIAIFIYMLLYAMIGVCITNQQQMQFAQLPVTILLIAAFVTSSVVLNYPESLLTKIMNYVPFVAPFTITNGILNGSVSGFNLIILGLIIAGFLALCNYFIVKVLIPKKIINY